MRLLTRREGLSRTKQNHLQVQQERIPENPGVGGIQRRTNRPSTCSADLFLSRPLLSRPVTWSPGPLSTCSLDQGTELIGRTSSRSSFPPSLPGRFSSTITIGFVVPLPFHICRSPFPSGNQVRLFPLLVDPYRCSVQLNGNC